jgi:hypothetical protein
VDFKAMRETSAILILSTKFAAQLATDSNAAPSTPEAPALRFHFPVMLEPRAKTTVEARPNQDWEIALHQGKRRQWTRVGTHKR